MRLLLLSLLFISPILGSCGDLASETVGGRGSACIVDNRYCYDSVDQNRCREIGAQEGDVLYRDGETCADNAYFESCADGRKYKVCP